jgi:heme-degrading monooxygenase HmoA
MDLVTGPAPAAAVTAMNAIPGVHMAGVALNTQDGPCGELGPESAGAILLLQGTFADRTRFEGFWAQAVSVMTTLEKAPGFIRRYTFADGPHYTLVALWRSVEDAYAFFGTPEHQAAMHSTFEQRWNYTHFAGLWQVVVPRERLFFCQVCDGVTPSGQGRCDTCGTPLPDPFEGHRVPAPAPAAVG